MKMRGEVEGRVGERGGNRGKGKAVADLRGCKGVQMHPPFGD